MKQYVSVRLAERLLQRWNETTGRRSQLKRLHKGKAGLQDKAKEGHDNYQRCIFPPLAENHLSMIKPKLSSHKSALPFNSSDTEDNNALTIGYGGAITVIDGAEEQMMLCSYACINNAHYKMVLARKSY